ncbi:MAG TPA: hypothetical protein DDW85_09065 [Porphyromonadaceae bacterium]|nr:hypothetical protein [Porphyromonadaceae bacterium]
MINIVPLISGKYVALGLFENGRYLLLDNAGKEISYNFDYPKFEGEESFTNAHKAMAFQGKIMNRPDGRRFFFACSNSELFQIFQIKNNKIGSIYDFQGEFATFVPEGDGHQKIAAGVSRDSKTKFIDAYCTQKYIYLLYSNRLIRENINKAFYANIILVYDWNGKAIKRYNLDIDVNNIAVNEDDNMIYASDNESFTSMVKFEIN